MDYHIMKRKELQALCKKNKIPANLTNLEMADRLTSLLKENGKPIAPGPSCLKSSTEVVVIEDSDVESKPPKKVKFSPHNELFEYTKTDPREKRRMTRRNSRLEDHSVERFESDEDIVNNPARVTRTRTRNSVNDGLVSTMNRPVERKRERKPRKEITKIDEVKLPTRRLLRNRKEEQSDIVPILNHVEHVEIFESDEEIVNNPVRVTRSRTQSSVDGCLVSTMNPPVEKKRGSKSRKEIKKIDEVKLPTRRLLRNREVEQNDAVSIQNHVEDAERFESNEEIVNNAVRATRSRTQSSADDGLLSTVNPPVEKKSGRKSRKEVTKIGEVKLPTRRLLRNREVEQNDVVSIQNHVAKRGRKRGIAKLEEPQSLTVLSDNSDFKEKQQEGNSKRNGGKRQTSRRNNRRKTVISQVADEEKVENLKADVVDDSVVISSSKSLNLENPVGVEEKLNETSDQDYATEEVEDDSTGKVKGTETEKEQSQNFVNMEEKLVETDENDNEVKDCADNDQASLKENTVAEDQEAIDTTKYVEISPAREFLECDTNSRVCSEDIIKEAEMTIEKDNETFVSKNSESVNDGIEDSVDLGKLECDTSSKICTEEIIEEEDAMTIEKDNECIGEGINNQDYQETVGAKESQNENENNIFILSTGKDNIAENSNENDQECELNLLFGSPVVQSNPCKEKEEVKEASSDEILTDVTILSHKENEGLKEIEQERSMHDTVERVNDDKVVVSVQQEMSSCKETPLKDDVIHGFSNMEGSVDLEKLDLVELAKSDDNLKLKNREGAFDEDRSDKWISEEGNNYHVHNSIEGEHDKVDLAKIDEGFKLNHHEEAFNDRIETNEGEKLREGENDDSRESNEDAAAEEHAEKPHLVMEETVAETSPLNHNVVLEHQVSVSDDFGIYSDLHFSLNATSEIEQAVNTTRSTEVEVCHEGETEEMIGEDESEHKEKVACQANSEENIREGCTEIEQDDQHYVKKNTHQTSSDEEDTDNGSNERWHEEELKILFATPVCENKTVKEVGNASFGKWDKTQEMINGGEIFNPKSNDSWHGNDQFNDLPLCDTLEGTTEAAQDEQLKNMFASPINSSLSHDKEEMANQEIEEKMSVKRVEIFEENNKEITVEGSVFEDGIIYDQDPIKALDEDTENASVEVSNEAIVTNNELGFCEIDDNTNLANSESTKQQTDEVENSKKSPVKVSLFVAESCDVQETNYYCKNDTIVITASSSQSTLLYSDKEEQDLHEYSSGLHVDEKAEMSEVRDNNIDEQTNSSLLLEQEMANQDTEDSNAVKSIKIEEKISEIMETALKGVEKVEIIEENKKDGIVCDQDPVEVLDEDSQIVRMEANNEAILINNELGFCEPDDNKDLANFERNMQQVDEVEISKELSVEVLFFVEESCDAQERIYDSKSDDLSVHAQGEAMVEVLEDKLNEFQEIGTADAALGTTKNSNDIVLNGGEFNVFTGSAVRKFAEHVEVDEFDKSNAKETEIENEDENPSSVVKANEYKTIPHLAVEDEELNTMFATPINSSFLNEQKMVNQEIEGYNAVKSNKIEMKMSEEIMESALKSIKRVEIIEENKKEAIVEESVFEDDIIYDEDPVNVLDKDELVFCESDYNKKFTYFERTMQRDNEVEISKEVSVEVSLFVDESSDVQERICDTKSDDLSVAVHAEGEVMSEVLEDKFNEFQVNKGNGECCDLPLRENEISVITLDGTTEAAEGTTKNSNNRVQNGGEFIVFTGSVDKTFAELVEEDEFDKSNAKETEIESENEKPLSVTKGAESREAIAIEPNAIFHLAVEDEQLTPVNSSFLHEQETVNQQIDDEMSEETTESALKSVKEVQTIDENKKDVIVEESIFEDGIIYNQDPLKVLDEDTENLSLEVNNMAILTNNELGFPESDDKKDFTNCERTMQADEVEFSKKLSVDSFENQVGNESNDNFRVHPQGETTREVLEDKFNNFQEDKEEEQQIREENEMREARDNKFDKFEGDMDGIAEEAQGSTQKNSNDLVSNGVKVMESDVFTDLEVNLFTEHGEVNGFDEVNQSRESASSVVNGEDLLTEDLSVVNGVESQEGEVDKDFKFDESVQIQNSTAKAMEGRSPNAKKYYSTTMKVKIKRNNLINGTPNKLFADMKENVQSVKKEPRTENITEAKGLTKRRALGQI